MADLVEEITKGIKLIYNSAYNFIQEQKYDEAEKLYENAASTCAMFKYDKGVAMALMSIANLALLQNDYLKAMQSSAVAIEYYDEENEKREAVNFASQNALQVTKLGIEQETKGNFSEALALFEAAKPYLNEKRAFAVNKEIEIIKGRLNS